MRRIPLLIPLAFLVFCTIANSEEIIASAELTYPKTVSMQYVVDIPNGYEAEGEQRYPLVLFLHGAGERGSKLSVVKKHGPHKYIADNRLPVIVVSPQCPAGQRWDTQALLALVDKIEADFRVDGTRIYVTGLSMGGFGTWDLLRLAPKRFAAAVPICGGGSPKAVESFKDVPIWVFHGGKDVIVPAEQSQQMVDALKATGSPVKFTLYPNANHDSWTAAYGDSALYTWLLQKKRAAGE